ncbi:MAG: DUF362 domain-containing protein [bacterium]
MKRRDFIKTAGITAGLALTTPGIAGKLFARKSFTPPESYDLVAVKNGEPDVMFDEAIKHLGGMKSFVKKGQKVLVKPNIGWDTTPERAANTHPKLVKRIIEQCYNAGAKEVYIFDHTCDDWKRCYENSGIEKAVKDAGGKIVPGNTESYYQEVKINSGKNLKSAKIHELLLDCDVFLNVPVLKDHGSARLTISMKNHMGVVWDRGYWHRNDLHQCIADFAAYRKPDLNIVDAYNVMKQNGPRGVSTADIVKMKSLIISRDQVAADTAAAKLLGFEPKNVSYIELANELGVGKMDLNSLSIKRVIL